MSDLDKPEPVSDLEKPHLEWVVDPHVSYDVSMSYSDIQTVIAAFKAADLHMPDELREEFSETARVLERFYGKWVEVAS